MFKPNNQSLLKSKYQYINRDIKSKEGERLGNDEKTILSRIYKVHICVIFENSTFALGDI